MLTCCPFSLDSPRAEGASAQVYKATQGNSAFAARQLPAVVAGRSRLFAEALTQVFNLQEIRQLMPTGMLSPIMAPLAHSTFINSANKHFTFLDMVRSRLVAAPASLESILMFQLAFLDQDILPWADGGTLLNALSPSPGVSTTPEELYQKQLKCAPLVIQASICTFRRVCVWKVHIIFIIIL